MRAAVIKGQKNIEIEEKPIPEIEPDQVLVRVKAVGICGSDLHGFLEENSKNRQPGLIMGHEAAGKIARVGSDVKNFSEGDRVTINPQSPCGECVQCAHDRYPVCDNMTVIGSSMREPRNGAMAEYVAVNQQQLYLLPDNVSMVEGAMLDPVGNALHVINRAQIKMGDKVAIIGAGTLGLTLVQVAKIAGAGKVIVTDLSDFRLNLAKEFGADMTINADEIDPVEKVLDLTDKLGVDVVVEAVGISETYFQAINMVRKRGKIMFFGNLDDTIKIDLPQIVFNELDLIGCTGFHWECKPAIELMAEGRINIKPIITHEFPLKKVQDGFEILDNKSEKVVKVILKS